MINEYIRQYTEESIPDIHQVGRRFYQIAPETYKIMQAASKRLNREPENAGLYLGEIKGKHFRPGFPLLDLLGKMSEKKVVIDDKAEWLFLCGRDIFGKSIVKANVKTGPALITNKRDEVLGTGNVLNLKNKNKTAIKNIIDRGDLLRREMNKKSKL